MKPRRHRHHQLSDTSTDMDMDTDIDTSSNNDKSTSTDTDKSTSSDKSSSTDTDNYSDDGWWSGRRSALKRSDQKNRKKRRGYRKKNVITPVLQYVTKDGYVVFEKRISKPEAKDWLNMNAKDEDFESENKDLENVKMKPEDNLNEVNYDTPAKGGNRQRNKQNVNLKLDAVEAQYNDYKKKLQNTLAKSKKPIRLPRH